MHLLSYVMILHLEFMMEIIKWERASEILFRVYIKINMLVYKYMEKQK